MLNLHYDPMLKDSKHEFMKKKFIYKSIIIYNI